MHLDVKSGDVAYFYYDRCILLNEMSIVIPRFNSVSAEGTSHDKEKKKKKKEKKRKKQNALKIACFCPCP